MQLLAVEQHANGVAVELAMCCHVGAAICSLIEREPRVAGIHIANTELQDGSTGCKRAPAGRSTASPGMVIVLVVVVMVVMAVMMMAVVVVAAAQC